MNREITIIDKAGIICLHWPSRSPDLNPIENIWSILKYRVSRAIKRSEVKKEEELWEIVSKCWKEIPISVSEESISSMPKRVDEMLNNLSDNTNFC